MKENNKEIFNIKKKAAEYQAKGLYKEALKELEKLLDFPSAVDENLYQRIGELHKKLGNKKKALEFFLKAVEGYKKHGSYPHLIPLYKKILEIDPERKELLLDLAEAYYQRNMLTEASKSLYEYANYLYQKGEIEEAFKIYQKLMEITPENIILKREVAELYLLHNLPKEAWKIYRDIFEHYKKIGREDKMVEIKEKLEEIEIIMGEEGIEFEKEEEKRKEVVEKEDEEEKDFLSVEEILKSEGIGLRGIIRGGREGVKEKEEEEVETPERVEEMEIERGEIPEVKEIKAEEVKEVEKEHPEKIEGPVEERVVPKGWEAVLEMAEVYWELGHKEDALEEYYNAAEGYYKDHDYTNALKVYQRIADRYPLELKARQRMVQIAQQLKDKNLLVESLLQLANCLYERGDKEKAKIWYFQILKRADPNCKEAKERLSLIAPELLKKLEKKPEAPKRVEEEKVKAKKVEKEVSIEEPKEQVELEEPEFIDLGEEIRKELEKEEKSIPKTMEEKEKEILEQIKESIYTHAQKIDPVDALEMGMAMKDLGLFHEAIDNLKKAVEGDDKTKKEAYHLLGQVYFEMKEFDKAIENLKKSLKIKTEDKEKNNAIYYDLARSYEEKGEWGKAIKYYKVLYEKDPASKELKQKILELARKIKIFSQKKKKD